MNKIQDIFCSYNYDPMKTSLDKLKAINMITRCKTSRLGGFLKICSECGHEYYSYKSCGNRFCPKCQSIKQMMWVEQRKDEMLDVPYFHMVFTIPDNLNSLFMAHQKDLYSALMDSVSKTIMTVSKQDKILGCKPGFITVLHTWGSNMSYHPHVHVLLAGCGIKEYGITKVIKNRKYYAPVKVLSRLFRGILLKKIADASYEFDRKLYDKDWVVFCKNTIKCTDKVVEYIGRYVYKTAISDARIADYDSESVTFRYKDYRNNCKIKTMTLKVDEFCRRYLMHILPPKFRKVRFCGFMANRNKKSSIEKIRKDLNQERVCDEFRKMTVTEFIKKRYGVDYSVCPVCKSSNIAEFILDVRRI